MGWASGSGLMSEIIDGLKPLLPATERRKVYKVLIECFENNDCDTLMECVEQDGAYEAAFRECDACYDGRLCFDEGKPKTANPHKAGSRESRDWDEGWQESHFDANRK